MLSGAVGRRVVGTLAVAALLTGLLATPSSAPAAASPRTGHEAPVVNEPYQVLFFHGTTGYRHASIPAAIAAVRQLGQAHGFTVTDTRDAAVFTDDVLANYAAVVLFTAGEDTLTSPQRRAFERFVRGGGGIVGLHSASNMDTYGWPWWQDLLGGATFAGHPPPQDGVVLVEDRSHPATAHLPARWGWADEEWYDFVANPRDAGAHVLLRVDEASYTGGRMGPDHPIAWCSVFDGGRTFYTALGHHGSHYDEAAFQQHLLGAIEWAAGAVDGDCGEPRAHDPSVCDRHQGRVTFPDAPGSGHRPAIDCLGALGVVEGADGRFRPADDVTRAQLGSFVARTLELANDRPMPAGTSGFPDLPLGATHGQAVAKLRRAGIVQGFEDGTFGPRSPVTREQTARYVVNAVEHVTGTPLRRSGRIPPDVVPGSRYASDIDALTTAGIVAGFPDGTFGPRRPVTRGQMARFVANALETVAAAGAYQGP